MAADNEAKRWKRDAFVPGRWVERNVKRMELDTPYVVLIDPSNEGLNAGSDYRLWVDEYGRPMLSGDATMPDSGRNFDAADLVGAHFGIMRTFEQLTGELREGYVVDLRYASPGDVPQIDTSVVPDDQEDLNSWLEFLKSAIPVAAVVVSKHDDSTTDPHPKHSKSMKDPRKGKNDEWVERDYDISGQAAFYPALNYLMAALDKEVIKARKHEKRLEKQKKLEELKKQEELKGAALNGTPEQVDEAGPAKDKVVKSLGESSTALVKAEG